MSRIKSSIPGREICLVFDSVTMKETQQQPIIHFFKMFLLLLSLVRFSAAAGDVLRNLKKFTSCNVELSGFINMTGSRPGTDDSRMFYWFTPAESPTKESPLIIWLQGKHNSFLS